MSLLQNLNRDNTDHCNMGLCCDIIIILLYDYNCMSNLIGPLLGNILLYCTGMGWLLHGTGHHGNKQQ